MLCALPLLALLALALGGGAELLRWGAAGALAAPWALVAGALLYLVPGLALLRLLWPSAQLSLAERLSLALSLSVALPPLLLLLSSLVGLPWAPATLWAYVLISMLALAWPPAGAFAHPANKATGFKVGTGANATADEPRPAAKVGQARLRGLQAEFPFYFLKTIGRRAARWSPSFEGALLATLALGALLARLYAARDLPAALWSDGYQHTLMAQLLVDHGGLFQSWQPYAPLATFTYHFGFHANVALFHWATGIDVIHSTLWVGQILNAAAVPLAFLLAARLSGSRTAGLWAAAITGCVSLMPAYYVNWGRYTQLAGQTALYAAMVCWAALLDARRRDWQLAVLTGIASACLALTHYRVAAFAGCFVAAYCAWVVAMRARNQLTAETPRAQSSNKPNLRLLLRRLDIPLLAAHVATAAVLALLLTLPWWLNVLGGFLVDGALLFVRPTAEQATALQANNAWGAITPFYVKPYVLLGAFVGLLAAAWRRQWRVLALALWAALVLLITNPGVVGLGGGGIITNFAVFIAAYVIVAPLCAYAIATALELLPRLGSLLITGVAALALLGWSAGWQGALVERQFALLGPEDVPAMKWVRANTPPDARFLINTIAGYSGTGLVGIDAGMWLPLAAGRATTVPPLTYASERAEQLGYAQSLLPAVKRLQALGLGSAEGVAQLRAEGVGYVYIGPQRNPDNKGWIDAAQLRASPRWQLVYERDGVQIFKLKE